MPAGKLLVLAVALAIILGVGLVVALVQTYPPVGLTLVAVGLFLSSRIGLAGENARLGRCWPWG